jgi:hypothetical protein
LGVSCYPQLTTEPRILLALQGGSNSPNSSKDSKYGNEDYTDNEKRTAQRSGELACGRPQAQFHLAAQQSMDIRHAILWTGRSRIAAEKLITRSPSGNRDYSKAAKRKCER